ncbi:MAG: hemolysin family protein [Candidatus Berkiella sp.]
MSTALYIALAIGFVFLNGFFVAAEFSIVKIRHTRVKTLEMTAGTKGRILAKIHQQLDAYLSACQLGITLASLGLGWVGEPAFATLLMPLFELLNIQSKQTIVFISFMVAFGIISYLHIVLGELMPKSLAIRQTQRLSLWTAVPLYAFYWLMYPAIWILNASSNFFLKVFRLDKVHKDALSYTTEEIKLILKTSRRYGEFDKPEFDLLSKSLIFTDLEISDVIRPISELILLNVDSPIDESIKKISEQRYTRYPVYKSSPKNVIGILHIKDLFFAMQDGHKVQSLKPLIRPILKVKDNDNLLKVFHKFRQGKPHFALVYSFAHPVGFVTLDDVLQELIGEIKDEFHITQEDWIMSGDGGFIIKGGAPIYTLETLLGIDLDVKANTISGLIFETLETFPKEGDTIEFEKFTLFIKKIRGARILQVAVYPQTKKT